MTSGYLDPATRRRVEHELDELRIEFRGVLAAERYIAESLGELEGARIQTYLPIFVHRFARSRLRALGQVQGAIVKDRPIVLFLCTHNAGRSAAARVLLDSYAQGRVEVLSAGSEPGSQINPAVVQILTERGLDATKEFPKPITDEIARAADVIVTMGCGDACPVYPGSATSTGNSPTPPACPSKRSGRSSTTSTGACKHFSPNWSPATPDLAGYLAPTLEKLALESAHRSHFLSGRVPWGKWRG